MILSTDQVKACLDSFPHGKEFTIKEISSILNIPADTVGARIQRDRGKYGRYLTRKPAGAGSTLEYRLDAEAIIEMMSNPKYRGQYEKTVNNPMPALTEHNVFDGYGDVMAMIDRWKNEGDIPQSLLERIKGMKYEFGTTWYPMESAPKDGTRIIVCSGNISQEILVAEWKWSGYGKKSNNDNWDWCIIYGYDNETGKELIVINPIGWMPCPLPPEK